MKLWRYITGSRKGKEAHRIEKDAMRDPFLADALEGYDKVKGSHQSNAELLQKRIQSKTKQKQQTLRAWSVAASILVVIGLGTYFLVNETHLSPDTDLYTVSSPVIHQEDSTKPDPIPVPAIAETTPKAKKAPKALAKVSVPGSDIQVQEITVAEESVFADNITIKVDSQALTRSKKNFTGAYNTSSLIKGKVLSQSGEPLIGVNVSIDGKPGSGTVSDIDGNFELKANNGSMLKFNYIGLEPVSLKADTSKPMLIAMKEDEGNRLCEVVVSTGIIPRDKVDLTESVSIISQKELKDTKDTAQPAPVDGWKAYRKYLKKNLIRPTDECKKTKGEVTLSFHIDSLGNPQNIMVIKTLCPSADQEAIRLVKEGPKWTVENGNVEVKVKF
ncbi:energy transducer TonB [Bacteroides sp. 224]|uniref:energy transducer TonB n=1 Tax=Bacteroides sp. 224 TaxID=2302936 RepID=UPI0013D19883|nr:carboxypeptidase-like regulatory domain-containing protein [Bacteroides sp. 224]NDV64779.1 hypothetical protein [Bacteroides sp. 224]